MRLHKLILVFIIISIILVALNINKYNDFQSWKSDRHYYTAAVGFAEYHPIDGVFTLKAKNGEKFTLFNNEDFGYWGRAYNLDLEYMQLPDSLSAHWVALRERKIFKGTFELPYQKIDSLFKMSNPNRGVFDIYGKGDVFAYTFIIGIEPDGYITLWIEGNYKYQKEIARFKAETTNKYIENATEQESIDELTERLFDRSQTRQLDSIFKYNIPADTTKWKNYSKKYYYYLQFENFPTNIYAMNIDFFNEEKDEFLIKKDTKYFIESGVPLYLKTNKFENDKDIRLKFSEELTHYFNKKQSVLKTSDTLVFLVKYDELQKSMYSSLTTVNEINR